MEGYKDDNLKIRTDLLPTDALEVISDIFTYGSLKYSSRNWEAGMAWGRLYAACLRHLFSFWKGEDYDKESSRLHLSHAACCILMLLSHQLRGLGKDDRNKLIKLNCKIGKSF